MELRKKINSRREFDKIKEKIESFEKKKCNIKSKEVQEFLKNCFHRLQETLPPQFYFVLDTYSHTTYYTIILSDGRALFEERRHSVFGASCDGYGLWDISETKKRLKQAKECLSKKIKRLTENKNRCEKMEQKLIQKN